MKRIIYYIIRGFQVLQEKKNLLIYGTKYRHKK